MDAKQPRRRVRLLPLLVMLALVMSGTAALAEHLPEEPEQLNLLALSFDDEAHTIAAHTPFFIQHGWMLGGEELCVDGELTAEGQAIIEADVPRFDLLVDGELLDGELVAGCFVHDFPDEDGEPVEQEFATKSHRFVFDDGLAPGTYEFVGRPITEDGDEFDHSATIVAVDEDAIFFEDVGGNVHEPFIIAIANAGITLGCEADRYCPDEEVTRGQMATFLARALGLDPVLPSGFDDVSDNHTHAGSIGAVADAGIAGGFGDGTYGPERNVTRGQMATFLARAVGLDPIDPPAD